MSGFNVILLIVGCAVSAIGLTLLFYLFLVYLQGQGVLL